MKRWFSFLIICITALSLCLPPHSEAMSNPMLPDINWTEGPQVVSIEKNTAKLKLPAHYFYMDGKNMENVAKMAGFPALKNITGVLFPNVDEKDWFILLQYESDGHVDDRAAVNAEIKDAKLLQEILSFKSPGISEVESNFPFTPEKWLKTPQYDPVKREVTFALQVKPEKQGMSSEAVEQHRLLGRDGVLIVTLVCPHGKYALGQQQLEKILHNLSFAPGKAYGDFVPGKDKVTQTSDTAFMMRGFEAEKPGLSQMLAGAMNNTWLVIGLGGLLLLGLLGGAVALLLRIINRKEDNEETEPQHNGNEAEKKPKISKKPSREVDLENYPFESQKDKNFFR